MKYATIFITFVIFSSLLGSIRFLDDNDFVTDNILVHANLDNRGSDSIVQDARVRVILLDGDGIRASSSQTDLGSGDVGTHVVDYDLYNTYLPPGEYWVRISAYGRNGERDIKHRAFIVQ